MRIGWIHIVLALVIAFAALMLVKLHNAGGAALLLADGKTFAAATPNQALRNIGA